MVTQRKIGWVFTAVGGLFLGAAAVGLSQPVATTPLPLAPARSPEDLSIAFRDVSGRVLPAVVSITSVTKPKAMTTRSGPGMRGPQEQMFREFFGDDPRFQEMFRNGPPQMQPRQQGAGSGFIVDPNGIILTNSHVVEGADQVTVTLQDGRELPAESWDLDPSADVAIVRVKTTEPLPSLVLGDSDKMDVGDWVLALGNPFNVGTTVTSGIISARGRNPDINERESYLQTDAAINPGNSGGPLVNLYGEVIGINTAISSRSGGYDGIGFAIPSNSARWVADQLIAHGEVRRSYLGVALQPLNKELRSQFNVDAGLGALVVEVFPETPAAAAGIQSGDIVLAFNGQAIADHTQLPEVIEQSEPGRPYPMTVLRDGKETSLNVELQQMPGDYTRAMKRVQALKSPSKEDQPEELALQKLGLEVAELNSELAQQLGLPEDQSGTVIKNVTAGSAASAAKLQAGDLVQRVGTVPVKSVKEFGDAISAADLSKGVLIHIKRGEGSAFVVLKDAE